MQNYNTVPDTGTFGEAVNAINTNFSLSQIAITELEKSVTHSKGLYPSLNALTTAIPSPVVGDWACVGDSFPAELYVCTTNGTWTDSGETYSGGSVDLDDYVSETEFTLFQASNTAAIEFIQTDKGRAVQVKYWQSDTPTNASNNNLWYDTTNNLLKKATVSGSSTSWSTVIPSASNIYIDVNTGGTYYWSGTAMTDAGSNEVLVTQTEYDALTPTTGKKYLIYETL